MPTNIHRSAQSPKPVIQSKEQMSGFILLEVLIAMSVVLAAWIGSVSAYQNLILRLGREQEKRIKIYQELDRHEVEQLQKGIHESARMSHRDRLVIYSNRPVDKK